LTTIVLTFGMSSPFSTIVVATSTSVFRATKSTIARSSASSLICPWATATRASGTRRVTRLPIEQIDSTRLWTKYTCPARASSLRMARVMTDWSNLTTLV